MQVPNIFFYPSLFSILEIEFFFIFFSDGPCGMFIRDLPNVVCGVKKI